MILPMIIFQKKILVNHKNRGEGTASGRSDSEAVNKNEGRGVSHRQALTIQGVSHYQAKALQYCPSPLRGIVLAAANLPDRPRERPRAPLNNEHGLRG